jgi:hypothetical protein
LKELYSDATNRYLRYNTAIDDNKSEGHVTTIFKNHLNISIMEMRLLDAFFQYMKNIDGHQDVSLDDVKVQESTVDRLEHDVDTDNNMKG